MAEDLLKALTALFDRLGTLATEDPELRTSLRRLGSVILELAGAPSGAAEAERAGVVEPESRKVRPLPGRSRRRIARERPRRAGVPSSAEQRLVSTAPPDAASPAAQAPGTEVREGFNTVGQAAELPWDDPETFVPSHWRDESARVPGLPDWWLPLEQAGLPAVEARCRLKAEAARYAARRHRDSGERESEYLALIARAKALPECMLWMLHGDFDPAGLEELAACFDTLGSAVSFCRTVIAGLPGSEGWFQQALHLTAEAQSMLRNSLGYMGFSGERDPQIVFSWLRTTGAEKEVYIPRYMRASDPADPSRWAELAGRINTAALEVETALRRVKAQNKLLGKIRHKASLICEEPARAAEEWPRLAAAVHDLVQAGLPPSDIRLRNLLLPALPFMPALQEPPAGFLLALRELRRFAEYTEAAGADETEEDDPPVPEMAEAARLLAGRSAVLIGGAPRPGAEQALREQLGLRELYWISARPHQSINEFEFPIARRNIAVVLLAIRWSSHSFGDVKAYCDRHGKPLVRLPAGYGPNQVAHQIVRQCGDRLAASLAEA